MSGRIRLVVAAAACLFVGCSVQASDEQTDEGATGSVQAALGGSAPATDYCYGAHGANCDGVPPNLNPQYVSGNVWRLPVSVGSQKHDQCCNIAHAYGRLGYMCGGNTDTNECKAEWDQAASDQLYGYVWWYNVDVTIGRPWSTTTPIAGIKAPSGTKLAVNYAKAGWCASGSWYYINLFTQAKCN